MTMDFDASEIELMADVLDACDPRRSSDEQIEAAERAYERDGLGALVMATSLISGMLVTLQELNPAADVMALLRQSAAEL